MKINKVSLSNISKDKIKKVSAILLGDCPESLDNTVLETYKVIEKTNRDNKDIGFHYMIDETDILTVVPEEYQINCVKGEPTYINNVLFNGKPQEHTISICLCYTKKQNFEKYEKELITFIVSLLRKYNLKSSDIWRTFDLNKNSYGPLFLLDKEIFKNFLKEIDKYDLKDKTGKNDSKVELESCFNSKSKKDKITINNIVDKIYSENKNKPVEYASYFQPWDKDNKSIKDKAKEVKSGELKTKELSTKNKLQYAIKNIPPGMDLHCIKAYDHMDAVEVAEETLVEPIYPDLITPPGGKMHIGDGTTESAVKSSSNTPITVEDFEKRQKHFGVNKFKQAEKKTVGRPINCSDPFPVDAQIRKLQEHFPKVKIDKSKYDLDEDNHPGSVIGAAMAKNFSMCYDMVTEVSKRTEKRLVKIENNLSTVMRNLFRLSSRMNINCVYYGGQSVYGKYNCIRCLHDDRINDGQCVSLDQCLCCTRYEPIAGQVYAILDEAGTNIVDTIDDMQMSYMDLEHYKQLSQLEEHIQTEEYANLKKDSKNKVKSFAEDKWKDTKEEKQKSKNKTKDGFVMDWNPSILETQKPAINKYNNESLIANKNELNAENQQISRELFIDSREEAVEYPEFSFDIKDYTFDDFGSTSNDSGSSFSADGSYGNGSDVRNKIVEYGMNAVKLCQQGKAKYSQDYRMSHLKNPRNGISYWDCSSLTAGAYNAAGITEIPISGWTGSIYPHCLDAKGGILFPASELSKALPGDICWFAHIPLPKDRAGMQHTPYGDGDIVHHVGIYAGNGQFIEAASANKPAKTQICVSPLKGRDFIGFGRPKKLIELDKKASTGCCGVGYWDRKFHQIPDEIWKLAYTAEGNAEQAIKYMNHFKYKDVLIKASRECGVDPYLTLSIAATETSGNPTAKGCGNQLGLLQTDNGLPASSIDGIYREIKRGLTNMNRKKLYLKQCGWTEDNLAVLVHAFNCGEGSVGNATGHNPRYHFKRVNLSKCKIPEIANAMWNYVKQTRNISMPDARRAYSTKVLRSYCYLYSKKVLG